ncbi:MAG: pyrroloquinoline quinone biosynthesis protein PqqB [Planctomycetes bacterium]|nr:pyrroloquinoline quinone biosynthesis protein PqqB [Planctomycetota bacterium]
MSKVLALLVLFLAACRSVAAGSADGPHLLVLGVAQDGGHPQAGCEAACCADACEDPRLGHRVTCLALVDPERRRFWLVEATPDFPRQLRQVHELHPGFALAGIFITHAHIGHYAGLAHLGREVMGTPAVPVCARPRLARFLSSNGPWSQLVQLRNIELRELAANERVELAPGLAVTPFLVPHRDEFSETAGFRIDGPVRSALFVPDIDKWERWERDVRDAVRSVDLAFVDGTFFRDGELARDMREVPHPFVEETLRRFADAPAEERAKLVFLHLNHTNPLLDPNSTAARAVAAHGAHVARELDVFPLD